MQELNSLCISKEANSCVTCRVRRWGTRFEPILQCVSRYTATRLVYHTLAL